VYWADDESDDENEPLGEIDENELDDPDAPKTKKRSAKGKGKKAVKGKAGTKRKLSALGGSLPSRKAPVKQTKKKAYVHDLDVACFSFSIIEWRFVVVVGFAWAQRL
jgi:hypothetical protein